MDKLRKMYKFYGRVQGVGFRYTAQYAARELGISGWVRNEWDGTVVMEAQGTREELELLVNKIFNGRFIRIDNVDVSNIPLVDGEYNFEVKY